MNKWKTARHWHNWGGLILALPMIIVGLTAIFIAHDKALGTKKIVVAEGSKQEMPEVKSVAPLADGSSLLGTKYGLWQTVADAGMPKRVLDNVEVRDIHVQGPRWFIAAKEGVYLGEQGQFRQLSKHDSWQLAANGSNQLLVATKEHGVQTLDLATLALTTHAQSQRALKALPADAEPYTLNKLVMDLHTGKFFFGKSGEWMWIDVLGAALVMLGLTGTWMWAKARRT